MPNWCENLLNVSGLTKDIEGFLEVLRGADPDSYDPNARLQFQKLYPLPKEEKDNWYDWCVNHWGTKWDIDPQEPVSQWEGDNFSTVYYDFVTAWAPPIEFIKKIASDFPELTFKISYYESGMAFAGYYETCEKDEVEEDEQYSFEYNPDEFKHFVLEEFGYDYYEEEDDDTW